MARIGGVDIPKNKVGRYALQYVYGIGDSLAREILHKANVDETRRVTEWTDDEVSEIRRIVADDYRTEGQLRSERQMNIKRLMDIGSYRGLRHRKGLPVRGQKTQTNARTRKGKKKTVANKKKVTK